nr:MAG TPA: Myc target protein 1 [Caudoviricetes sp.]
MTQMQNFMLSVCFGATLGLIIGSWWFLLKEWIKDRKEKKKKKEQH